MSEFVPDVAAFSALKDRVVVLTGGATGIGAAITTLLVQHGAHVVFGDINTPAATALVTSTTTDPTTPGTATYVLCDVRSYDQLYTLFRTALDTHGRVDHAISCAGIFETGKWFDPDLTVDTVGAAGPGPPEVIDINLMGSANFSRLAVVFMKHDRDDSDKSLTLLSSVNAFRESPGLYMYQTSKHAIQGLMRAMRRPIHTRHAIRVNCVCPGVTDTEMTRHIIDAFKSNDLYWQSAESVARIVLGLQVRPDVHGKAIYIEGGDGWEFEDSFYSEQPRWLGVEATRRMRVNSEAVNKGALTKGS